MSPMRCHVAVVWSFTGSEILPVFTIWIYWVFGLNLVLEGTEILCSNAHMFVSTLQMLTFQYLRTSLLKLIFKCVQTSVL